MGDKLWAAIVALGVVDMEGQNKLVSRIGDLEFDKEIEEEGWKVKNKIAQRLPDLIILEGE